MAFFQIVFIIIKSRGINKLLSPLLIDLFEGGH